MTITVLVTGRSYHTAARVPDQLELPDGSTVDDALEAVNCHLPGEEKLPASCLVAVSGEHLGTVAGHRPRVLVQRDELVLIAPVAGG
jgi:molybdopterin converting factor small subunit